jgi:hypothetical protein
VAHPEVIKEDVHSVDDAMEIEDTGPTSELDLPPKSGGGKPSMGYADVNKEDAEARPSQSEEPVSPFETTSTNAEEPPLLVTAAGGGPPDQTVTMDQTSVMEDMDVTGTSDVQDRVQLDREQDVSGTSDVQDRGQFDDGSHGGEQSMVGGGEEEGEQQHAAADIPGEDEDDEIIDVVADSQGK